MNANLNQRLTAEELNNIYDFWKMSNYGKYKIKYDYYGREIKKAFEERYQIYQSYTKWILMLYIPVEHLHLAIYQNLSIHFLLLHNLKKMVLYNKFF